MSVTPTTHRIEWSEPVSADAYGPRVCFGEFAGESVDIVVASDQAALLIVADEVHGVLLEGNHLACVLREGEEPGDLGDADYAERLRIERSDVAATRQRLRMVQQDWHLVHVALSPLPAIDFGTRTPAHFDDRDHGPLELELTGVCRLRVADPVCFYDSFLRRTGDLSSSQFEAISSAVVEGGVVRALDQAFESIDEIERDHERLAAILATRLATPLLRVGLGIDEIECTRLHTPVGLVRAAILSDSPAYEPSLARAEPRP